MLQRKAYHILIRVRFVSFRFVLSPWMDYVPNCLVQNVTSSSEQFCTFDWYSAEGSVYRLRVLCVGFYFFFLQQYRVRGEFSRKNNAEPMFLENASRYEKTRLLSRNTNRAHVLRTRFTVKISRNHVFYSRIRARNIGTSVVYYYYIPIFLPSLVRIPRSNRKRQRSARVISEIVERLLFSRYAWVAEQQRRYGQ